jgi:hypothetical protein
LRSAATARDRLAVADFEQPFEDGIVARLEATERVALEQRHAAADECAIGVDIGAQTITLRPGQPELTSEGDGHDGLVR